ncbi:MULTISPECIES: glycosyltransferase family 2 protein [unclassified Nitratiruptor]|uniref:glycosyltransferase family 2 protein n=1 Tax=unclassified Nitratiruptor TaxID=2624044 RepID=UPI001916367E|nr:MULTISPECIES: glycosyltransferase family 2 protein [unclassified Nitratiruptor]BCD60566.1 glycosyl transferase [Nitratiruptor sp. YY08-10]BCD64497.1 glycosyl transferase [Nitratiruptor sp. YY08-14]
MSDISVIIPIFNEEKYIAKCLDSIIEQEYPKEKMEVLLIDGGSSDKTIDIIKQYQEKYPFFRLLHNSKKIVPTAMNIGIKNAKGEYIIRLDAHSSYPKDYLRKLIYWHKKLGADNVGGIVVTKVKNKTKTSNAIKNVLSDRLGVGSTFRSGVDAIKEVDTVPFGCYKKEIFNKIGLYDERLVRNQDIELNKRLKKMGGKIYLIPDIKATYYARETFKDLAKNSFENGKWNILTAYYTKTLSSLSLRHFIPLLFVLALLMSAVLSFFFSWLGYLFLFLLAFYLTIITLRSLQIKKDTSLLHQVLAFLVLHFSYGFGSLAGLLDVLEMNIKGQK